MKTVRRISNLNSNPRIMMYVTYYGGSYVPQNQLEKDQIELLEKKDRILLADGKALEVFKENTLVELNKLNLKNYRCKPFKPSWHKTGADNKDTFISGIRVVRFYIYVVNQKYKTP